MIAIPVFFVTLPGWLEFICSFCYYSTTMQVFSMGKLPLDWFWVSWLCLKCMMQTFLFCFSTPITWLYVYVLRHKPPNVKTSYRVKISYLLTFIILLVCKNGQVVSISYHVAFLPKSFLNIPFNHVVICHWICLSWATSCACCHQIVNIQMLHIIITWCQMCV